MTAYLVLHPLVPGDNWSLGKGRAGSHCADQTDHTQGQGKVQGALSSANTSLQSSQLLLAAHSGTAACTALQEQKQPAKLADSSNLLKSSENWVKCIKQCSSMMFTQKTR